MSASLECCVLLGGYLCDGTINGPVVTYCICVCVCVPLAEEA
jgi:hypothetical protein